MSNTYPACHIPKSNQIEKQSQRKKEIKEKSKKWRCKRKTRELVTEWSGNVYTNEGKGKGRDREKTRKSKNVKEKKKKERKLRHIFVIMIK